MVKSVEDFPTDGHKILFAILVIWCILDLGVPIFVTVIKSIDGTTVIFSS